MSERASPGALADRAALRRDPESILEYVQSFYSLSGPLRPGDARTKRFLDVSRLPIRQLRRSIARITGTNGKGTTAVRVEHLLRAVGRATICLTSPHVYSVRERIRINGVAVTWDCLGGALGRITPYLEELRGTEWQPRPTDIWAWIALFLHASSPSALDGIYEVGKGGGSDVINVFSRGTVGLTNLGTDHLDEFGGMRETLLIEKLGLCLTGDILCHGPLDAGLEARLRGYCASHGITCFRSPAHNAAGGAVLDSEDGANSQLARDIVEALGVAAPVRVERTEELPARIQERLVDGRRFVLDGGHNVEATRRLVARLADGHARRVVIFGAQVHKDWRSLIRLLASVPGLALLVAVKMASGASVCGEELAQCARHNGLEAVQCAGMRSALALVLRHNWHECIITGSFKLFRDFELALHRSGLGAWAIPLDLIYPGQPWMRALR